MARPSHSRALSIWANGERVGLWLMPATGAMELRYDASWQTSPTGRPLSLSLPFGVGDTPLKGEQVANYFDNLLPDSQDIRRRIATRFRTNTMQTFDLLQAVGRDCVGAVQLLGENDAPTNIEKIEGTPLSESDIERWLRETTSSSIGADDEEDDFRISLAGAQEKTALGVAPHHKYEAHGGPGVREIANVLRQSEAAHQDIETFLSAQIVYWMLAAPIGPRKELQHSVARRRSLSSDSTLRCDVYLACRGQCRQSVVVVQSDARHGDLGKEQALQNA